MDVGGRTSLGDVRTALHARTGLPAEHQALSRAGGGPVLADDARLLSEYGIGAEASLQLNGRLLGGGGKKKAKIMPKVKALERYKLPTSFLCIFCDHKTVSVKMCVPLSRPGSAPPKPPFTPSRGCRGAVTSGRRSGRSTAQPAAPSSRASSTVRSAPLSLACLPVFLFPLFLNSWPGRARAEPDGREAGGGRGGAGRGRRRKLVAF